MPPTERCTECGAELTAGEQGDFCQRCLLTLGLDAADENPSAAGQTDDASATAPADIAIERPGTMIGRYQLLEQIGEGGFGVVYMAEQVEPVQRKVALKIIKAGMDTKEVVARFEAERQALALMDHPNIARVLDAGATQVGRPYFVMELVQGFPITGFCDQRDLNTVERIQLFMQVCKAVQHAHQKGIIHRDLKPSNILVTHDESGPLPKVIDFGVAKALGRKLTEKTLFTGFLHMVGTPAYMSPEQAEFTGIDIDTRTDIYSLGVLLYELLTGETPFDAVTIRKAALEELRRMIREIEPPKPSTRLQTLGDRLTEVAKHRHTEPPKLIHSVQGDLDWIVMKCLEKDRHRRYETANGLAMDVQRHLSNEPILARPPSKLYEFQKTVRRHKFGFAAAAALVAVLAAGALVSTWQAVRATRAESLAQTRLVTETRAREQASTEAAKASAISDLLLSALQSANPVRSKGSDYTVRELLEEISANLGDTLEDQPEVEIELRNTIGLAFWRLGIPEPAEPQFERALELARRVYGPEHERVAEALVGYGRNLEEQGRREDAEAAMREAVRIYRLHGTRGRSLLGALGALQVKLEYDGRLTESEEIAREALAFAEGREAESPELASILHNLARVMVKQGDSANAENVARRAVAMHRRLEGNQGVEMAWALTCLAEALAANGKHADAQAAYREALAVFRRYYDGSHRSVTMSLAGLESALRAQDDLAGLEEHYREEIGRIKANAGDEDLSAQAALQVAELLNSLADVLDQYGKPEEVEAAIREMLAVGSAISSQDKSDGETNLLIAGAYLRLAKMLLARDAQEEAHRLIRLATEDYSRVALHSPDNVDHRLSAMDGYVEIARICADNAEFTDEGQDAYRHLIAESHAMLATFPTIPRCGWQIGHKYRLWAFAVQGNSIYLPRVEQAFRKSIELFEKDALTPRNPHQARHYLADTYRYLGDLLVQVNRPEEAEASFRRAIEIFDQHADEFAAKPISESELMTAYIHFARFLVSNQRSEEAAGILGKALKHFARATDLGFEFDQNSLFEVFDALMDVLPADGRLAEAEVFYRREMARIQALLGDPLPAPQPDDRNRGATISDAEEAADQEKLRRQLMAVHLRLGDLFSAHNDPRALEEFLKALDLDPDHAAAHAQLAYWYKNQGSYDKAMQHSDQAVALNDGYYMAYERRAEVHDALKHYQEAVVDYDKALSLAPDQWWIHRNRGNAHAQLGNYQLALDDLEKGIAGNPDYFYAVRDLARLLASCPEEQFRDPSRAVQLALQAVRLEPNLPTAWSTLAEAYQALPDVEREQSGLDSRLDKLRSEFVEAHHPDDPTVADWVFRYAGLLDRIGKTKKALTLAEAEFSRQRELRGAGDPKVTVWGVNLGMLLLTQGRLSEAAALFQKGAEHADPGTLNGVAWAIATSPTIAKRDGLLAVGLAEKAVRATGRNHHGYLDTLAAAYAEAGQFTNAVHVQQKAIALVREADEAHLEEYESRLKLYQTGTPYRDAGALAMNATALLQASKFGEAEPIARECLAIREVMIPDHWLTSNARSMLGGALAGQKKFAEAEPLLISGYEGMIQRQDQIPPGGTTRPREALERIMRLYTDWNKPDQVAAWKKKLPEIEGSTHP